MTSQPSLSLNSCGTLGWVGQAAMNSSSSVKKVGAWPSQALGAATHLGSCKWTQPTSPALGALRPPKPRGVKGHDPAHQPLGWTSRTLATRSATGLRTAPARGVGGWHCSLSRAGPVTGLGSRPHRWEGPDSGAGSHGQAWPRPGQASSSSFRPASPRPASLLHTVKSAVIEPTGLKSTGWQRCPSDPPGQPLPSSPPPCPQESQRVLQGPSCDPPLMEPRPGLSQGHHT